MSHPGSGPQATLSALLKRMHRRSGRRRSSASTRRSFARQPSSMYHPTSILEGRYDQDEPSQPRIRLRWQYRILKWAIMPAYFVAGSTWALLLWCWHIVSARRDEGSNRHRWDWRRRPKPSKLSKHGFRGSGETGRFSYIAQLLLAARGNLYDEHWMLTDWKIPIQMSAKFSSGDCNNMPTEAMSESNTYVRQPRMRAAARGRSKAGQVSLHLPPQDLFYSLMTARSASFCPTHA